VDVFPVIVASEELKVKGLDYSSAMSNRKPTPSEARWIENKIAEVNASGSVAPIAGSDNEDWFKTTSGKLGGNSAGDS